MTVTDTGPGIPAELREHAKQRFVRLDAQRSTPGSGLGLSLVEAVAKLHDAKLTLERQSPGPAGSRWPFGPRPPGQMRATGSEAIAA